MTENKRFECNENKVIDNCTNGVTECKNSNEAYLLCKFLNEQDKTIEQLEKENERLKSEINMLKTTIGRNEAYIKKLTETNEWHC